MQKRKRDWKKAKQQKKNRVRMPETPPQEQEQEEETPKSRLTQAWWCEQDLGAEGRCTITSSERTMG